jgi:choline dehydrogenase-like flavoprotein
MTTDEVDPFSLWYGLAHHMSSTRMHVDPTLGVTDANGRVHGTSNLYCAGSSAFSTGGYANPTLTALALTVRLADHLRNGST